jgi:hypothetical protein
MTIIPKIIKTIFYQNKEYGQLRLKAWFIAIPFTSRWGISLMTYARDGESYSPYDTVEFNNMRKRK